MAVHLASGSAPSYDTVEQAFGLDHLFKGVNVVISSQGLQVCGRGKAGQVYPSTNVWPASFMLDGQPSSIQVASLANAQPDLETYVSQTIGGCIVSRELQLDASLNLSEVIHASTSLTRSERTAWHEAGHAVVALLTGRGLCTVTISDPTSETGGRVHLPHMGFDMHGRPSGDVQRRLLRSDMLTALTGPRSVAIRASVPYIFYPEPDRTGSLYKAHCLSGRKAPSTYAAAELIASGIASACWAAIEAVAQELIARAPAPLLGSDVYGVVETQASISTLRQQVPASWRLV